MQEQDQKQAAVQYVCVSWHKLQTVCAIDLGAGNLGIESNATYLADYPQEGRGVRSQGASCSRLLCCGWYREVVFCALLYCTSEVVRPELKHGREGAGRNHRLAAEGRMRRPENSAYSGLLRAIRKLYKYVTGRTKKTEREKIQTGLTGMSRHEKARLPKSVWVERS